VFERAESESADGSCWRIAKVTTLHRDGKKWANEIVYAYQPGCDRLRSVTDPFGNEVLFGYDETGRLTGFVSGQHSVTYGYDDADHLRTVTHGSVALSFNRVADVHELYGYRSGTDGSTRLVSYQPFGQKLEYRYGYDDPVRGWPARIRLIDEVQAAGEIIGSWRIAYTNTAKTNITEYIPPAPTPKERYFFGGNSKTDDLHSSADRLPHRMSIPGRNATWHYRYNSDALMLETLAVREADVRVSHVGGQHG